VVLVDARDLDPAEGTYLATSRVRRRAVAEIQADDLLDGPLILLLDVDVIDPAEVPGLRFPEPGCPPQFTGLDAMRRSSPPAG
jgi:arginase